MTEYRIEDLDLHEYVAVIRSLEKHIDYVEESISEALDAGVKPDSYWSNQKTLLQQTLEKMERRKIVSSVGLIG